jgi:hypothetical protein
MSEQLNICLPVIIEISFEIVVLPVTGFRLPVVYISRKESYNNFIPDRRIFTFRLLGKPSLGQSPP